MKVAIKLLSSTARKPQKMSSRSSGYDLYSSNTETIKIPAGGLELVPTGLSIGLEEGYEAQIRPRSGLAVKHQIGVLNSPGTIDSDYRGEIKVILYNFGKEHFELKPGMRIAQMVIARYENVLFEECEELEETERGAGGFGHTGV